MTRKETQEKASLPEAPGAASKLEAWRTRALNASLIAVSIVGIAPLGFVIASAVRSPSEWSMTLGFVAMYLFLLALAVFRQFHNNLRKWGFLLTIYAVGVLSLARSGLEGTGALYLLVAPVLTAVLVGGYSSLMAAAFSLFTFAAFAFAIRRGWVVNRPLPPGYPTPTDWTAEGTTLAMLMVASVTLQWLFSRFQSSLLEDYAEKAAELDEANSLLQERAEELNRYTRRLKSVVRVSGQTRGLVEPEDMVRRAVTSIEEELNFEAIAVYLTAGSARGSGSPAGGAEEGDDTPVRLRAAAGIPPEADVPPSTLRMVNEVTRSGESRFVQSSDREAQAHPTRLVLPLQSHGNVIGALVMQASQARPVLAEEDVDILRTMADQIAASIRSARLHETLQRELSERREAEERLERHVDRLEVLRDIDQAILAAKSAEEVAEVAMRRLRRLVPCRRASIGLFDFEADEIATLAVCSSGETRIEEGRRFPLARGKAFRALRRGETLIVEDLEEVAQSAPALRALYEDGLRSLGAVPLQARGELIGVLVLGAERMGAVRREHLSIARQVADSVAIAIQQARLLESLRRRRQEVQEMMARMAEAEEMERHRVARMLHDRVGQNLTALGLNVKLVQSQAGVEPSSEVYSRLEDSLQLVEETTERVRHLMSDLRPPMLKDYGLVPALEWYGDKFSSRSGVAFKLETEGEIPRLSDRVENTLYRIAQEALTNVAKHAQASEVRVTLAASGSDLRLKVVDDGVGLESNEGDEEGGGSGWGLLTMRERAEAVDGRCEIESSPEGGTCVIVEVPR